MSTATEVSSPEGEHSKLTGLDEEAVARGIESESHDIEGTTPCL